MKKIFKWFFRLLGCSCLVVFFFFLATKPARAPHGGKKFLGGRTIASIQEEDFDKSLYKYRYCYGIKFSGKKASQERRRACKAILVHKVEEVLQKGPGAYFKEPLQFQCDDTSLGPVQRGEGENKIFALRPNDELVVLERWLNAKLDFANQNPELEKRALDVCSFLVSCRMAMGMSGFSLRKIASCIMEDDEYRRRVMMNALSQIVFHEKNDNGRLVAEILHGDY